VLMRKEKSRASAIEGIEGTVCVGKMAGGKFTNVVVTQMWRFQEIGTPTLTVACPSERTQLKMRSEVRLGKYKSVQCQQLTSRTKM
jgi:hypothetical protein